MTDLALQEFKKVVRGLFAKQFTESDVVQKYGIKREAQPQKHLPSKQAIYDWFKVFRKEGGKGKSKSKGFAKDEANTLPNSENSAEKKGFDDTKEAVRGSAPRISLSTPQQSGSTPDAMPVGLGTEPTTETQFSDYPELKFLKIVVAIPSRGASDFYTEGFKKRGVDLNDVPLLNYSEWKALQVSSAEAAIKKYTTGYLLPEWLRKLEPFYPLVDLAASYLVPSVAGGLWVRFSKGETKTKHEETKPDVPPPLTTPQAPTDIVKNPDGSVSYTQDGKRFILKEATN